MKLVLGVWQSYGFGLGVRGGKKFEEGYGIGGWVRWKWEHGNELPGIELEAGNRM